MYTDCAAGARGQSGYPRFIRPWNRGACGGNPYAISAIPCAYPPSYYPPPRRWALTRVSPSLPLIDAGPSVPAGAGLWRRRGQIAAGLEADMQREGAREVALGAGRRAGRAVRGAGGQLEAVRVGPAAPDPPFGVPLGLVGGAAS